MSRNQQHSHHYCVLLDHSCHVLNNTDIDVSMDSAGMDTYLLVATKLHQMYGYLTHHSSAANPTTV